MRQLAKGGMGVVYEAEHAELGRRVALKLLRPEFARDHQHALERFRLEALATASLNHPHIVQVTAFETGPPMYIVMELLAGETLRARMLREPARLPEPAALAIIVQTLAALAAAHGAGIVHRDIKPENLFLMTTPAASTFVKVLDFGIAKHLDPSGPLLTADNEILGSLGYMPPEQIAAAEITERTDIYSVGIVLYELVCGHMPFEANRAGELIRLIVRGAPQGRPAHLRADIWAIILRAIKPTASERFASAAEMQAAVIEVAKVTTAESTTKTDQLPNVFEPPLPVLHTAPLARNAPATVRLPLAGGPQQALLTKLEDSAPNASKFAHAALDSRPAKLAPPAGWRANWKTATTRLALVLCALVLLGVVAVCAALITLELLGNR